MSDLLVTTLEPLAILAPAIVALAVKIWLALFAACAIVAAAYIAASAFVRSLRASLADLEPRDTFAHAASLYPPFPPFEPIATHQGMTDEQRAQVQAAIVSVRQMKNDITRAMASERAEQER